MACSASKLKVGDFLSRVSYMRVVAKHGDTFEVENETGLKWRISGDILENEARSSNEFTKTERVTRTELARILEQDVRDSAFNALFTKLPDPNDQSDILEDADLSTPAKRKRAAKDVCTGKERVMHGHIIDTHELAGDADRPRDRLAGPVRGALLSNRRLPRGGHGPCVRRLSSNHRSALDSDNFPGSRIAAAVPPFDRPK